MASGNVPYVPETVVLPPSWDVLRPTKIKVNLAPIDDMGFPYDRRGVEVVVPNKTHHKDFAKELGKQVERTVLFLLGYNEEEEQETDG